MKAHLYTVYFILTTFYAVTTCFDPCGCDWKKFKNHCYYFSKFATTWYHASIHCSRQGGYLAKVNSKQENDWLKGTSKKMPKTPGGGFWLGAEDIVEKKWQWQADNSALSFTDWNKGQPDNARGIEDCLHLSDRYKFHWNDASCSHKARYICERPMFLRNACKCYA